MKRLLCFLVVLLICRCSEAAVAVVRTTGINLIGGNTIQVQFEAQGSWGPTLSSTAQGDLSSSLGQLAGAVKGVVITWAATPVAGSVTLLPNQVLIAGLGDDQITGVRKVSDDSTSSTAFSDVPGLVLQLAPNSHYKFKFKGAYTTAATTTAIQLSVNGPASPTFMRALGVTFTTATAVFSTLMGSYDATANPATGGGATALPFEVEGTISTGAAGGAFTLRFRSEVNASAVTILRGSFGELISVG